MTSPDIKGDHLAEIATVAGTKAVDYLTEFLEESGIEGHFSATENIARVIVDSLNTDCSKNRLASHANIVDAVDDVATALHAIAKAIKETA